MANNINNGQEFGILGFNVKFRPEADDSNINAEAIISLVKNEATKIKKQSPKLNDGEVAILVAIEMTRQYMKIEGEYKSNVNALQSSTHGIINLIDNVLSQNNSAKS